MSAVCLVRVSNMTGSMTTARDYLDAKPTACHLGEGLRAIAKRPIVVNLVLHSLPKWRWPYSSPWRHNPKPGTVCRTLPHFPSLSKRPYVIRVDSTLFCHQTCVCCNNWAPPSNRLEFLCRGLRGRASPIHFQWHCHAGQAQRACVEVTRQQSMALLILHFCFTCNSSPDFLSPTPIIKWHTALSKLHLNTPLTASINSLLGHC